MAYPTLPNSFAASTPIYSSHVSGNILAVLQGYTTGTYDAYVADLACKEISVNAGNGMISSGGTATFAGNLNVAGSGVVSGALSLGGAATIGSTLDVTSATTIGSTLGVNATATIGGDVSVTGNATAAAGEFTGNLTVGGSAAVTGDVYTTVWADITAATAAVTGYDNGTTCINSYRWKQIGKMVWCSINLGGTSTATTMSFNLPVSAGTNQIDMYWPGAGQDNGASLSDMVVVQYTVGVGNLRVDAYVDATQAAWTNANNKALVAQWFYEVD